MGNAHANGPDRFCRSLLTSVVVQGQRIAPPELQTARLRPTARPVCAAPPGASTPAGAPTVGAPAIAAGAHASLKTERCRRPATDVLSLLAAVDTNAALPACSASSPASLCTYIQRGILKFRSNGERSCLRVLLLHHVRGATRLAAVRTYNCIVQSMSMAACATRGLLRDDDGRASS